MKRFASVVLVDRRGWVLLQERDEHPVLDPEKWGFVGGGVEAGESYADAAVRELLEETGLSVAGLSLFGRFDVVHQVSGLDGLDQHTRDDEFELYVAATDLGDDDIVVGEGRQIVFVQPDVALGLDLTASAVIALPVFLASSTYDSLSTRGVS